MPDVEVVNHGSEIIGALEDAWQDIQERHADVPNVVFITGQGRGNRTFTRGHFQNNAWGSKDGRLHELFIAAELFHEETESNTTPGERVLRTMLHEAAHGLASVRGIKDCSRNGNVYHNKRFAALARELGLTPPESPSSMRGYSECVIPDETVIEYVDTVQSLEDAFAVWVDGLTGLDAGTTEEKPKGRGGQRTAYECGCDEPRRIQLTPKQAEEGALICGNCQESFEETAG